MADERIIELETATEVLEDDYLAIDSVSGETRKIKPIKIGATYEIEDGDHEFTLVGSNGYEHTVAIPYDSVSMTQAEYDALTPAQKADGTARFITDAISTEESELWSRVGRGTLHTDAQVISNAVNELKDKTDENTEDISELNSSFITVNSGSIYDISKSGIYYLTSAVTDKPISSGGVYVVGSYNDETITGIFISVYTNEVFQIRKNSSTEVANRISVETVTITGTTSSTGAILVPTNQQAKRFLNALLTTGSPGFVVRRDASYFTVFNNDGTAKSNTAVVFEAYFI